MKNTEPGDAGNAGVSSSRYSWLFLPACLIFVVRHQTHIPIMTPLEAIPAIEALLERLIHQSRDAKTLALVKQVETPYRVLQSGYFKAEKEALEGKQQLLEANRKIGQMEDAHPKAIAALQETVQKEIAELKEQIDYWKTQAATKMDETLRDELHKQSKARQGHTLHYD